MSRYDLITRRTAIADLGKAGLAVMVFGAAACSREQPVTATTQLADPESATEWERVVLGNVSAYILYRSGEAALVDTGNPGSEQAIEASLADVGLGWDSVGHVILTHNHGDHIGSLGAVVTAAPDAEYYAGLPDAPAMTEFVTPIPIATGDKVFDLDVIETPGHTPGHTSILDSNAKVLVAGDALFNINGDLAVSLPQFTENQTAASSSVKVLAQLQYDTALFGHGDPILTDASQAVAALAAGAS